VNCWLVNIQGLMVSDIVWSVEVYEGQDGGVTCCDGLVELSV
jgi:hypothetical protein